MIIEAEEVDLDDSNKMKKSSIDEFKAHIKHGGKMFLAHDGEYLAMKYNGGEALPVWMSMSEAKLALPVSDWK